MAESKVEMEGGFDVREMGFYGNVIDKLWILF